MIPMVNIFSQQGTTTNGTKYLDFLNDKLNDYLVEHHCNIFMRNGATRNRSRAVKNYLQEKNVDKLYFPESIPDLNLIGNLWHVMKTKVSGLHPTMIKSPKTTIAIV